MPAIELEHVTKIFHRRKPIHGGIKSVILHPVESFRAVRTAGFTAVHDVSFRVERGETLGLLGRNGAGKSTILGMIGGVLRPTAGKITVQGQISPLLELGVGFVPDLTGIENALLNGVLLGLRRREVKQRLPEILEFAGLGDFAEQPLKSYSSGMQTRLGFSVAVHADPDVLLVDEVLSVGDAEFQERCISRISKLRRQGVTILFVSHDLPTVEKICDRAVWINEGELCKIGDAVEVSKEYKHAVGVPEGQETALELLARQRNEATQ